MPHGSPLALAADAGYTSPEQAGYDGFGEKGKTDPSCGPAVAWVLRSTPACAAF